MLMGGVCTKFQVSIVFRMVRTLGRDKYMTKYKNHYSMLRASRGFENDKKFSTFTQTKYAQTKYLFNKIWGRGIR